MNWEAPKYVPRVKRIAGGLGVPSCSDLGEGDVGIEVLGLAMIELPGVIESGMSRKNGQRKPGTTRGSPRRSRTAKASRISRLAVKVAMCSRVRRMGSISDDGSRQHNSSKSEDPWGGGLPHLQGGALFVRSARHSAGLPRSLRRARKADTNQTTAGVCREQA